MLASSRKREIRTTNVLERVLTIVHTSLRSRQISRKFVYFAFVVREVRRVVVYTSTYIYNSFEFRLRYYLSSFYLFMTFVTV